MAYSEKIINYAKELYLIIDDKGNRQYSFQEIVDKISRKFRKKVTAKSISLWAKNNEWEILLQQSKNIGQQKALSEKFDNEETIKENISNDIAERRKIEKDKYNLASNLILDTLKKQDDIVKNGGDQEIDLKVLATICKNADDTINNLDGIDGNKKDIKETIIDRIFGE